MNVNDLQQFLRSLSQPLSVSGAKKVADDLERACAGLEPFRNLSVAQFADFLGKADEYDRTGVVSTPGRKSSAQSKTAAKASNPQSLADAVAHIRALYDRVASPEVTYGTIEAEVKKLDKPFKKDEIFEIAKGIDIQGPLKTKRAALDEIHRRMTERKESFQRTQF